MFCHNMVETNEGKLREDETSSRCSIFEYPPPTRTVEHVTRTSLSNFWLEKYYAIVSLRQEVANDAKITLTQIKPCVSKIAFLLSID